MLCNLMLHTFCMPRSSKSVPSMPFLRRVSHTKTIKKLQDLGIKPVIINPESRSDGTLWNNISEFLNTYWVWYCYYEGLPRNHGIAKSVHAYLFHGLAAPNTTDHSTKRAPILRTLHRAMTQGRARYGPQRIAEACTKLTKYLLKNPNKKKAFYSVRKSATDKFLAYVEDGLRNLAQARGSPMGRNAMDSAKNWEAVGIGRKMEPFVAIAKHFLGCPSFAIWKNFDWGDYILLKKLQEANWGVTHA